VPSPFHTLVADLDGTLLASDGSVSPRNRLAIRRLRQAGIDVMIATGRTLSECRTALAATEHQGFVIAAGGSLLCDASSGATVDRRVIPRDVVAEVTRTLIAHGHRTLVLKDNHVTGYDYLLIGAADLNPASTWWFNALRITVRHADGVHEDEHPDDTLRAGAVAHHEAIAPIAERLRLSLDGRATLQHWAAVTESKMIGAATHLLEVFQRDVNKWTMLESYCAARDLDPAGVVAIGDGLNDIELIANAGLGVAMANADPRARAVAARTTAHHDEDGFAIAVEHVLSGAWS
jgi:hypothetical protein